MAVAVDRAVAEMPLLTKTHVLQEGDNDPRFWSYFQPLATSANPGKAIDDDMKKAIINELDPTSYPTSKGKWPVLRQKIQNTLSGINQHYVAHGNLDGLAQFVFGLGQDDGSGMVTDLNKEESSISTPMPGLVTSIDETTPGGGLPSAVTTLQPLPADIGLPTAAPAHAASAPGGGLPGAVTSLDPNAPAGPGVPGAVTSLDPNAPAGPGVPGAVTSLDQQPTTPSGGSGGSAAASAAQAAGGAAPAVAKAAAGASKSSGGGGGGGGGGGAPAGGGSNVWGSVAQAVGAAAPAAAKIYASSIQSSAQTQAQATLAAAQAQVASILAPLGINSSNIGTYAVYGAVGLGIVLLIMELTKEKPAVPPAPKPTS